MQSTSIRKRRTRLVFDRYTAIVLAVFIVLAGITAVLAFRLVRDTVKSWTMTPLDGVSIQPGKTPEPGSTEAVIVPEGSLDPTGPTPVPWDKTRPVTVLVMGLDYSDQRATQDFGPPHTDTMILFSYDPMNDSVSMLSIPRDLWVNIPGYDYAKINTAYRIGEANQLPGGGPGLAVKTVESFLGVPINYYAQIDFSAFERFIDEIGGIKITVEEEMTIDPIGDSPKVKLTPGRYTLNGELALAYARQRKTGQGDIDRSRRQMQVILAIRDRLLEFDQLPSLIAKAPRLYSELSSGIRTNLSLNEVISIGSSAYNMPKENIKQAVIGYDQVYDGFSPDGQSILIPIPDQIRLLRDEVFTAGGPLSPAAVSQDYKTLAEAEGATISVQNGTYTSGIASSTAQWLRDNGLNVVEETNADGVYSITTIIIYDQTPNTAAYIRQLMEIDNAVIINSYQPDIAYDIAVILGDDWAYSNPMP